MRRLLVAHRDQQQVQAHFVPRVTRLAQEILDTFFLRDAIATGLPKYNGYAVDFIEAVEDALVSPSVEAGAVCHSRSGVRELTGRVILVVFLVTTRTGHQTETGQGPSYPGPHGKPELRVL